MNKRTPTQTNKQSIWRWIQLTLVAGIVVSAGMLVWQLARPLSSDDGLAGISAINTIAAAELSGIEQPESTQFEKVAEIIRPGLFKSETPLSDKPMADKTIEKILSQLKLQCIMNLNGEPVAYIRIKGEGMKKYKIGDVTDQFTVLDIGETSIEISIIGHKAVLSF